MTAEELVVQLHDLEDSDTRATFVACTSNRKK